jgi:FtsP/CotA-like multicopper oxidase with cupredoxin domain
MPGAEAADDRKRFAVTVTEGRVAPGQQTLRVTEGDRIEIEFTSDRDMALHLHGIDVEATIVPGQPSVMRFDAAHAGRFPVEAHGGRGHATMMYIEVHPR